MNAIDEQPWPDIADLLSDLSTPPKPARRPTVLLTLRQVGERLQLSRSTVERMIRRGELRTVQLGGRGRPVRVEERELRRCLRRRGARL